MSDQLPQGWATGKLNDVVRFALGGDWGKDPGESCDGLTKVRVIRGTEFKTWRHEKGASAAERRVKFSSLEKRRLRKGDLVLEVSGGGPNQPVGRTVLIDDEALKRTDAPLVCSNFFRLLRLHSEIDSNFISYFLSHAYGRGVFNEFQTETTNLRNLNVPDFLEKTDVVLAPLKEQRRIVAKLEKVLDKVDACQQRLAKIPILLKRFRQSVLAAACSGRLTADWREENPNAEPYPVESVDGEEEFPANWRATRLGGLTTLVTSGSRGWAKYYSDSGSTFIRAQNINSDFLNFDDIAFVRPPASAEGLRTRVRQHDILVTITGANVTKSALVEKPIEDAYISQHVALVRLKDTRLSKFAFQSVIGPAHGRKQLLAAAYGQGKPGLN
jgi:restriction endonuclease S subunit